MPDTPRAVVCAVAEDGAARPVTDAGAALAGRLGAALRLVHVDGAASEAENGSRAERLLEQAARRVRASVDVTWEARNGDTASELLRAADAAAPALVVAGSRGRARMSEATAGSVTARLAAEGEHPVLVVPAGGERTPGSVERLDAPIVIGVCDPDDAGDVVAYAPALARRIGAPVCFAHVLPAERTTPSPALLSPMSEAMLSARGARAALDMLNRVRGDAGSGVPVDVALARGDPAPGLLRVAEATGAMAVAVATRRRGPLRAALLGSTSRDLVRSGELPVLLVPRSPDA